MKSLVQYKANYVTLFRQLICPGNIDDSFISTLWMKVQCGQTLDHLHRCWSSLLQVHLTKNQSLLFIVTFGENESNIGYNRERTTHTITFE